MIEGFVARHVNVALQVHGVDLNNLFDHLVEEVDPSETHLSVDLVRLSVAQATHVLRLGLVLDESADLVCHHTQICCCLTTSIRGSFLGLQIVDRSADVGEHLSFKSFRLRFHYVVQILDFLLNFVLNSQRVILEILNIALQYVVFPHFGLVVIKLLFVLLLGQMQVKPSHHLRHLLNFIPLDLDFALTSGDRRQTPLIKVFELVVLGEFSEFGPQRFAFLPRDSSLAIVSYLVYVNAMLFEDVVGVRSEFQNLIDLLLQTR